MQRAGALPYRWVNGVTEVLLVTSRLNGDWVIPKGHLEPDMTPPEVAVMEAFEEAGVRGKLGEPALGSYVRGLATVLVFPLEVTHELDSWPEQHERKRAWFPLEEAVRQVPEADLRALIEKLGASLP
jgi:8-oxo-dGTP pyrophosphatase MutT (NUDIX family)